MMTVSDDLTHKEWCVSSNAETYAWTGAVGIDTVETDAAPQHVCFLTRGWDNEAGAKHICDLHNVWLRQQEPR
jgi:hypothetical protein